MPEGEIVTALPVFKKDHPRILEKPGEIKLVIKKGDIIKEQVDAIVNPTNEDLIALGGLDLAIHRAAGKQLIEACAALHGCPIGEAKITPGYNLKAKYIIHTVGPIYEGGKDGEADLLASCYRNILALAKKQKLRSIAIPAISTGAFGYPKGEAALIVHDTIYAYLKLQGRGSLKEIRFILFDQKMFDMYRELFRV